MNLYEYQEKITALNHACEILFYDGATTAPKGTAANRARTLGILSEEIYKLSTSDETIEMLKSHEPKNLEEKRMLEILLKDYNQMQKIPMDEYVAYQELLVKADDVWHRAKETSDFALYEPVLTEIFETNIRFAGYIAPEKDPYDFWLSEYEDGLTMEICDDFFGKLKEALVPLIKEIGTKPQLSDECIHGHFPAAKQEEFSYYLMKTMGLNLEHVGLGTTEHPFTTSLGSHLDERITTNYKEDNFASSMFSVIHEGGHALYDTNCRDEYAFTVLDQGVSMGIHESQSRFYENLLGRSKEFAKYSYCKLVELFPEMSKYSWEDVYKAVNRVEPSLIRIEADELTYSLHVMIRYEVEKALMHREITVHELPEVWNRLYKEYLGVDVPDEKHGCLQDSHWSGGSIGYFPSYALGSAYGAQFLYEMKKDVDVEGDLEKGDFSKINAWNKEHIWQYGHLYKPNEILNRVLSEDFTADYYIQYLKNKFSELYGI